MTYDEIMKVINNGYRESPTTQKLNDIIICAAPLEAVEKASVIKALMDFKAVHGMSKAEIKKEMSRHIPKTEVSKFFDDMLRLKPVRVVEELMETRNYLYTVEDEVLRIYQNGVFNPDEVRTTEREIIKLLSDEVNSHSVSNVMSMLAYQTAAKTPRHTEWINLANGRLDIDSWELLPHDPSDPSVIQLPVAYNANAQCPVFCHWLNDVLPREDDQFLLLQLIGYSMLQDVRFGKIVVLYGPTHTGKSTCLDLLTRFLGKSNVSALSLHALDDESLRFTRSGLVGKLANVSADLSSKYLSGDSQVKQIAVGDPMQVEFKGVQSFTINPFATLWASANQLPVSHDRTDAWYERLVLLPFTRQHKGQSADRHLLSKMTTPTEMSGILNKVLVALKVLLSENAFRESQSTKEMTEAYRLENDHVSRFLSETCEKREGFRLKENEIYKTYTEWCDDEGIKQGLSKTKFRDGVKAWGGKHKRANDSGERYFIFEGLTFL